MLFLLALAALLLSLTGLFRISLALTGHLADKPGLTTRITMVLVQEKLAGPGEPNQRLLPNAAALRFEGTQMPFTDRLPCLEKPYDFRAQRHSFVGSYAIILFRCNSNFV